MSEGTKEGICPLCRTSLQYAETGIQDNWFYHIVWCPNKECNFTGKEWHKLIFDEITNDADD